MKFIDLAEKLAQSDAFETPEITVTSCTIIDDPCTASQALLMVLNRESLYKLSLRFSNFALEKVEVPRPHQSPEKGRKSTSLKKYSMTSILQNSETKSVLISLIRQKKLTKSSHCQVLEFDLTNGSILNQFRLKKSKKVRAMSLFKTRAKQLCLTTLNGEKCHVYDMDSGTFLRSLERPDDMGQMSLHGDLMTLTD